MVNSKILDFQNIISFLKPNSAKLPICKQLQLTFGNQMGRVYSKASIRQINDSMQATFRSLIESDYIFSCNCPIRVVVFESSEHIGHVGWYFKSIDSNNFLWGSIHKNHVDFHFPLEYFPEGRPEVSGK